MRIGWLFCGLAAALAGAAPASAQIVLEANGARADGHWGGELGVGYGFGAAGFRLTPMVGVLVYNGDDDRYDQTSSAGNTFCRDRRTGQFTSDSRCDGTAVTAYGRVEATYAIPLIATVGAGVRVGSDLRPYGTVAVPLLPTISLKGNAGPHYFALGLRLGL